MGMGGSYRPCAMKIGVARLAALASAASVEASGRYVESAMMPASRSACRSPVCSAIALQTGLRHAERLAGIMALSTYLPLASTLAAEASAANRATPIFMAHGLYDPPIPIQPATMSRRPPEAPGY